MKRSISSLLIVYVLSSDTMLILCTITGFDTIENNFWQKLHRRLFTETLFIYNFVIFQTSKAALYEFGVSLPARSVPFPQKLARILRLGRLLETEKQEKLSLTREHEVTLNSNKTRSPRPLIVKLSYMQKRRLNAGTSRPRRLDKRFHTRRGGGDERPWVEGRVHAHEGVQEKKQKTVESALFQVSPRSIDRREKSVARSCSTLGAEK